MSDKKKCWACGKTLTGGEKIGLCEGCLNKYGSPAVAAVLLGVGVGSSYLLKNGGKIFEGITKIVKR